MKSKSELIEEARDRVDIRVLDLESAIAEYKRTPRRGADQNDILGLQDALEHCLDRVKRASLDITILGQDLMCPHHPEELQYRCPWDH